MNEQSDIGDCLKKCREAQGLSLQDIAHQTRIPASSLVAIEANNYADFPSPAYAKSFVQQYSEFLGYEADEWLDNFQTGDVILNSGGIEYLDQADKRTSTTPPPPKRSSSPQGGPIDSLSQPLLILLITGGLIAAGFWGFLLIEKRLNPEKAALSPPPNQEATPALQIAEAARPPVHLTPDPQISQPEPPPTPVIEFLDAPPPPRAIIVEDDEVAPLTPDPSTDD